MFARAIVLRGKLGSEGLLELGSVLDEDGRKLRKDVLETATDRFERRLIEETSSVRLEMAAMRVSIIRWMIGLLIAQTGLLCGLMPFMLNELRR